MAATNVRILGLGPITVELIVDCSPVPRDADAALQLELQDADDDAWRPVCTLQLRGGRRAPHMIAGRGRSRRS